MIELQLGNIIDVLPTLGADTFDGCLCDPPYELGFMGKRWDASGITYSVDLWRQVYRVLKPGAYLLAFGGTRTSHRLACAIEDAGFEIRDTIDYVYGSGFPKSLDVSKAIDKAAGAEREVTGYEHGFSDGTYQGKQGMVSGYRPTKYNQDRDNPSLHPITAPATDSARIFQGYGTALKPAHEPIIVARKPLSEATVAANCQKWGTGALNIDAGRIETNGENPKPNGPIRNRRGKFNSTLDTDYKLVSAPDSNPLGRWPANLITDGSAEVVAMFPQSEVSGSAKNGKPASGEYPGGFGGYAGKHQGPLHNDSGSAARFFKSCPLDDDDYPPLYYCAKASKAERDAGCEGMEKKKSGYRPNEPECGYNSDGDGLSARLDKSIPSHNHHPTVKPISLTRYLATLILPPAEYAPRKMLVPFAGVASEMIGAILAGWDEIIGIEREAEYCDIGHARLEYWQAQLQLTLPMVTA